MKYEIGQGLYWATWDTSPKHVVCPDCGGTGRLRVTFHDETQVSIDCRNCAAGYDPPSGKVKIYERIPRARFVIVTGVEITEKETRWHTSESYIVPESELFGDEVFCMAYAQIKAREADKAELDKVLTKEKDTRTWAWNASYHRRCIKDAEKQIAYHMAKLNVAAIKAKTKEPETV